MSTRNFAMLFGIVFLAVGVLGFLGEPFTAAPHGEHPAGPEQRRRGLERRLVRVTARTGRAPGLTPASYQREGPHAGQLLVSEWCRRLPGVPYSRRHSVHCPNARIEVRSRS